VLHITALGRSPEILMELVKEARRLALSRDKYALSFSLLPFYLSAARVIYV
jgi:hypothetical protein